MSDVDLSPEELGAEGLAGAEAAEGPEILSVPAAEGRAPVARWYAVQVASSCEKKVKA